MGEIKRIYPEEPEEINKEKIEAVMDVNNPLFVIAIKDKTLENETEQVKKTKTETTTTSTETKKEDTAKNDSSSSDKKRTSSSDKKKSSSSGKGIYSNDPDEADAAWDKIFDEVEDVDIFVN